MRAIEVKLPKPCKSCGWERFQNRTECLDCIRKKEREKAKEKMAKERASSRINIRLSWVEESDRDAIREKIKEAVWPYLWKKQIQIKVSRGKSSSNHKKLRDKADDLWSEAVKVNYNKRCAYCGTSENLNSHHIFTRSRMGTRWNIDNGICLCANHHTFSQQFSAHGTPAKFNEWLIGIKWEDFVQSMERFSLAVTKVKDSDLESDCEFLANFIKSFD